MFVYGYYFRGRQNYIPRDHRELVLLSCLSQLVCTSSVLGNSLHAVQPYTIPWSSVAIHVCHSAVPNSQLLAALNGSWVALCAVHKNQVCFIDFFCKLNLLFLQYNHRQCIPPPPPPKNPPLGEGRGQGYF